MDQVFPGVARPTLKALLAAYERRIIEEALREADGNQRRAARALGVLPTTLHEKMKRLGLLHRAPRGHDTQDGVEAPVLFA